MATQTTSRPARARGTQRSSRTTPASPTVDAPVLVDSEETRALRRKFSDKLTTLKEVYPNWSDDDLLSLLSEVNGNVEIAVVRISEGIILFAAPLSRQA